MKTSASLADFDPNDAGNASDNIYGLPFNEETARLIILPVPWEVTVSYRTGTALGPKYVQAASFQVDLFDPLVKDAWQLGITLLEIDDELFRTGTDLRIQAEKYLDSYMSGDSPTTNSGLQTLLNNLNQGCEQMVKWVREKSLQQLSRGKLVGLLGGDHSTPLGLIQALAESRPGFGILQIDAHADLRVAYEGFTYSHASIMYNALQVPGVAALTQVGIRDYCEAEKKLIDSDQRIKTFFDYDIKARQFAGVTWQEICKDIIKTLPQNIYLSIDIDGFDPKLCPDTGTPVPGGFEFEQVVYLVNQVVQSGKKIIGFDINEVSCGSDAERGEWNAIVGARLLYRIGNLAITSICRN